MKRILLVLSILVCCFANTLFAETINGKIIHKIPGKVLNGIELEVKGDGSENIKYPGECFGYATYIAELGIWRVGVISVNDLSNRPFVILPGAKAEFVITKATWMDY